MSTLLIKYLVAENLFALRNGFGPVITLFDRYLPSMKLKIYVAKINFSFYFHVGIEKMASCYIARRTY